MTAHCSFICNCPKLVINEMFTKGWTKNQTVIYPYNWTLCCCCSVMQSCSTLWAHGLQHTRLPCPSPSPRACSNSCLLSQWCHPTISSYVTPFSSCLQSFPASGSFLMSRLFASGGQSTGASASLGLTDLISFHFKGLSSVFPNTTDLKHQFFGVQLSLRSDSHIHTWQWKNIYTPVKWRLYTFIITTECFPQ